MLFRRRCAGKVALRAAQTASVGGLARGRSVSWRPWRLCVKSFFQTIDDASDAALDQNDIEVDEQSQTLVGQLQIGEKLLLMHRRDGLHSLDFHDHLVRSEEHTSELQSPM